MSTDAAVRVRITSSVRTPFDARTVWTREPGARPRLSGLGRDRPRARHPDDVSTRPRSQPRDFPSHTIRTVSASTPTRLARVRSSFVTPPWVGDASETLAPVRSSSRSPARVIVRALAVRARSRVSESAVHASGRRDRRCVSTVVLHSEPSNFEQPCLVCSWRRDSSV